MGDEQTQLLKAFVPVSVDNFPKDNQQNSKVDLFIYLPTENKFILYVAAGDRLTYSKKTSLERHVIPALFVEADAQAGAVVTPAAGAGFAHTMPSVLGARTSLELKNIFRDLAGNIQDPPQKAIERLEGMVDELVACLAPDVDDLKTRLKKNTEYLWVMNDQAAITSIGILFASAYGIDQKKPLRDMICAGLVMDLPLGKIDREKVEKYLVDPRALNEEERKLYEQHPLQAYQVAKHNLKHFSDATFDMILNHHELNNGTGYPRKVRSMTLSPLTRIFAFAVDVFEEMKRSMLLNKPKTLVDIVAEFADTSQELHLRRHSKDITTKAQQYLSEMGSL